LDLEVTALADIRPEFLEKAAQIWPHASKFTNGMELINQADVEVVHICLPSYLHAEHAITAMKKGLNVFIEKPVCLTEDDCLRLTEAEKSFGVKVMVGQVVRCFDEYAYLRDAYKNQTFGKLKSIMMHRVSGDTTWGQGDWFHDITKSGSVVMDLHIHDVDFLRYLLGEPDSFTVNSTSFDSGMPNQVITTYHFGDVFAVVEGTWDISTKLPFEAYFRACFENATVVFSSLHEPHLAVYGKDKSIEFPELNPLYKADITDSGINISNLGPYYTEINYFYDCLLNNKPIEIAPLSEGIASVRLALQELGQAVCTRKGNEAL
jgi:predicted dehydrogenase